MIPNPPQSRNIESADLDATGAANEFVPKSQEDKAAIYGELAIWTRIDDAPLSLLCVSPRSGNTYRLDYDEFTDKVRCSCPRGFCRKSCWHVRAFRDLMLAALYATHKAMKALATAQTRPEPDSSVQHADDWDEPFTPKVMHRYGGAEGKI